MNVAFDRRHDDFALGACVAAGPLFRLHERKKPGHGLFHDARAFDHLGQEHFARTKEIAHHAHAGHQGAFDDGQRTADLQPRLLRVGFDVIDNALDQRVFEPLLDGSPAPFVLHGLRLVFLLDGLGKA